MGTPPRRDRDALAQPNMPRDGISYHGKGLKPMTVFTTRPTRRALLCPAILSAGLLAGSLWTPTAHAVVACRTDPIVTLSNGVTVQMSNTIYDDSAHVQPVTYTLRAPAGTRVTRVVYPPGTTTSIPESFQFAADRGPGEYRSYAVVHDAN